MSYTFKVMKDKCDTCIFRPGNLMFLESGRVKEMVKDCEKNDSYVICHETIMEEGVDEAACKGYIEAGHDFTKLQLARRLGVMEEV